MKALEKDRARRYETVNGLARDLERYLAGDPVEAGPPSTTYRLRKFAGRHRVGLAMAATMAVLLVAGVVVSTWMAVRASRAEAEARPSTISSAMTSSPRPAPARRHGADTKPDPDLKVRTALDRAAARIEWKVRHATVGRGVDPADDRRARTATLVCIRKRDVQTGACTRTAAPAVWARSILTR